MSGPIRLELPVRERVQPCQNLQLEGLSLRTPFTACRCPWFPLSHGGLTWYCTCLSCSVSSVLCQVLPE